jgi:hypothetical protein
MTTTQPTTHRKTTAPAIAVTVVLVLSALVDFANLGGYLAGASIPPVIVGVWVALGVAALAAAGGLWAGRRWAATLAIAVAVITVLLGAIGTFTSESTTGKVVAAVGAILGLVVIALAAARATRGAAG